MSNQITTAPQQSPLPQRFVAMDLETTGTSSRDFIVEIALVEFINGKPSGNKLCTLVKPPMPIPEGATKVHGITDEMVADAPSFAQLAGPVCNWLTQGIPVVGHNIEDFDMRVLAHDLQVYGFSPPAGVVFLDTLKQARSAFPGADNTLGAVAGRLGVNVVGAHRAEADAVAAGLILVGLFELGIGSQGMMTRPGEAKEVTMARQTVLGIVPRLGQAAEFIAKLRCNDENDLERCTAAGGRLKQIEKQAEESRKAQVDEITKTTNEINGLYRERIKKPIAALLAQLDAIVGPYQTEKANKIAEEQRRKREEAEKAAQAERDRAAAAAADLARAAAETAAAAAAAAAAGDAKAAETLGAQAEVLGAQAETRVEEGEQAASYISQVADKVDSKLNEAGKTSATTGSASVEWEYFNLQVLDESLVPQKYWVIDMAKVQADLVAGIAMVPGVTYEKRVKTKFRGKSQK